MDFADAFHSSFGANAMTKWNEFKKTINQKLTHASAKRKRDNRPGKSRPYQ
jgi:hypothetical protein